MTRRWGKSDGWRKPPGPSRWVAAGPSSRLCHLRITVRQALPARPATTAGSPTWQMTYLCVRQHHAKNIHHRYCLRLRHYFLSIAHRSTCAPMKAHNRQPWAATRRSSTMSTSLESCIATRSTTMNAICGDDRPIGAHDLNSIVPTGRHNTHTRPIGAHDLNSIVPTGRHDTHTRPIGAIERGRMTYASRPAVNGRRGWLHTNHRLGDEISQSPISPALPRLHGAGNPGGPLFDPFC